MIKGLRDWLEVRVGVEDLIRTHLKDSRVPANVTILSTLGITTFFAFLVQVVSGIVLLIFYIPHPEHAFPSVQQITNRVPFGWLFRQIHVVGSNLLVAAASLHMLTVFLMGNYKKPREATWLTGALMLYLVLFSGLTGFLLPWSQLSYWATTMVTSMPAAFPVAGPFVVKLLRGGDHVSGATLSRFFALHVGLLPMLFLCLGGIHYLLIRRIGLSATPFGLSDSESRQWTAYARKTHPDGHPYYPDFLFKQLFMISLSFTVLFFFVSFFPNLFLPEETGIPADPQKTPLLVRPVWYFLAPYQLLKLIPNKFFGISIELILVGIFLFWPFLDTEKEKNVLKRPLLRGVFLLLFALWLVLLFWGRY